MFALIPARGGSKSIPRKNIVPVGGHPLIAYTIAACHLSQLISRIIVSTEDSEIAEIAAHYGAEVPFLRPAKYSTDISTDLEFLAHFFSETDADEAVLMRPVTPLRSPELVDRAITTWAETSTSRTSLRSVEEVRDSPYKLFRLTNENLLAGFFTDFEGNNDYTALPRQTFPKAYRGNGYTDIVKASTVTTGSSFGHRIQAYVTPEIIDIDSPGDLDQLRSKLKDDHHELLDYLDATWGAPK